MNSRKRKFLTKQKDNLLKGKIVANDMTHEGLKSNIHQELVKLNIKKKNKQKKPRLKKWAEGLNRHFSKEETQIPKRHMKRCSLSLLRREMQIKTTTCQNR